MEIGGSIELAFWLRDAEASASSDASASCYEPAENVFVLPIVVAEGKLGQIQRQILLAYLMVIADHATLEKRPERFNRIGEPCRAPIRFGKYRLA